jgi:hypothetical protein
MLMEEDYYYRLVSVRCRPPERRLAVLILHIDVNLACAKQQLDFLLLKKHPMRLGFAPIKGYWLCDSAPLV